MSGEYWWNMVIGDVKEIKDILLGIKVICIMCFDEKIEGEVVVFDYGVKVVIISIFCCFD